VANDLAEIGLVDAGQRVRRAAERRDEEDQQDHQKRDAMHEWNSPRVSG